MHMTVHTTIHMSMHVSSESMYMWTHVFTQKQLAALNVAQKIGRGSSAMHRRIVVDLWSLLCEIPLLTRGVRGFQVAKQPQR